MNNKRIQCTATHPRNGTQCWASQHPKYEEHWAMVPIEGTDRAQRVSWSGDGKD